MNPQEELLMTGDSQRLPEAILPQRPWADTPSINERTPAPEFEATECLARTPIAAPSCRSFNQVVSGVPSRTLTREAFDGLLAFLDRDRDLAGEKYEVIRGKLVAFFEHRGCMIASDLADLTVNRVARKIAHGQEILGDQPIRYFYGIARNVLREHWRTLPRRLGALEALSPSEHPSHDPYQDLEHRLEVEEAECELEALEECLRELSVEDRDLILKYHEGHGSADRITHRKRLAAELGIPAGVLRLRAHRIKSRLKNRFKEHLRPRLEDQTWAE
ncbi:MAG TPA: hypothetical protein VJX67_01545 [Blastocatellia bacterium]|nr:hypothetical protein [Blastocatellia bacterium]